MKKTLHGKRHIRARYTVAIGREKRRKRKEKKFLDFCAGVKELSSRLAELFAPTSGVINELMRAFIEAANTLASIEIPDGKNKTG